MDPEARDQWTFPSKASAPAGDWKGTRGSYENPVLIKVPEDASDLVCVVELVATCRRRRQYDALDLFEEDGASEAARKPSMARAGSIEKEPRVAHVLQQAGKTIGSWTRLVTYDWGKGLTVYTDADRKSAEHCFVSISDIKEIRMSTYSTHAFYIQSVSGEEWDFGCDSGTIVEQ